MLLFVLLDTVVMYSDVNTSYVLYVQGEYFVAIATRLISQEFTKSTQNFARSEDLIHTLIKNNLNRMN